MLAGAPQRNLVLHGKQIYYADDHTPITGFKFFLNFMNEIFYGASRVAQAGGASSNRVTHRLWLVRKRRLQLSVPGPPTRRLGVRLFRTHRHEQQAPLCS